MERTVEINGRRLFLDGLLDAGVVIFKVLVAGVVVVAACKRQNSPLAGSRAEARFCYGGGKLRHGLVEGGLVIGLVAGVTGGENCDCRVYLVLSCGEVFHDGHDLRLLGCIAAVCVCCVQLGLLCTLEERRHAPAGVSTEVGAVAVQCKLPADNIGVAEIGRAKRLLLLIFKVPACAADIDHEVVDGDHPAGHAVVVKLAEVLVIVAVVFVVGRAAVFGDDRGDVKIALVDVLDARHIGGICPVAGHGVVDVVVDEERKRCKTCGHLAAVKRSVALRFQQSVYLAERVHLRFKIQALTKGQSLHGYDDLKFVVISLRRKCHERQRCEHHYREHGGEQSFAGVFHIVPP